MALRVRIASFALCSLRCGVWFVP